MSKYSDLEVRMRGYEEVADYKLTPNASHN